MRLSYYHYQGTGGQTYCILRRSRMNRQAVSLAMGSTTSLIQVEVPMLLAQPTVTIKADSRYYVELYVSSGCFVKGVKITY